MARIWNTDLKETSRDYRFFIINLLVIVSELVAQILIYVLCEKPCELCG
jgi:disulfide bond formation protein DsbB